MRTSNPTLPDKRSGETGTAADVRRWVTAGLLDDETALAIIAFEEGKETRIERPGIGRGAEALAYLGSVLVMVALGILANEFWDRIEPLGRFALTAFVIVILYAVGLILGRSAAPAATRAQSFAWLLTVAAVALAGSIAFTDLFEIDEQDVFLLTSVLSLASALALWWTRNGALQLIAVWVTANLSLIAGLSQIAEFDDSAFGLSLAGFGLIWIGLTWRSFLTPTRLGFALGAVDTLLIAFPEMTDMPWPLLGLGVGLGLMALSVRLEENLLLGLGIVGLFVYIPMTILELFGESLGVPVALLATGVVLLGVVIYLVRRRERTDPVQHTKVET